MDALKLQTDMLKSMFKGERVIHCKMRDGRVAIGTGYFLGILPEDKVMLRFASEEFERARDMFNVDDGYELAEQKHIIQISPDGGKKKIKCGKYETESGRVAFINIDYLKYFDKGAKLYVKGKVNPMLVFEDDVFCGVIMTVNVAEM